MLRRSWPLLALFWLTPGAAGADVVMPLRERCDPPRVLGVRNHREVCLDPPPEDCPPGWRGVAGGQCAMAFCADDAQCGKGERCVEAALCHVEQERAFCEAEPFAPPSGGRGASCEPPRECPPDERVVEVPVRPCVTAARCEGRCKPGRLCLAPGATPALGPPGGAPSSSRSPRRGGCAGCIVGRSAPAAEAMVASAMLLAGLAALTARRR